MVTVSFFGAARLDFDTKEIILDAKDIASVVQQICQKFNITKKKARQYLYFVNEQNITELKMWRTKLNKGDKIMLLSPASGG